MSLRYQKEIVSSWFDRRNADAQTSFDPFIYTWIAFNAALSARFGRGPDKRKIEWFADEVAGRWAAWLESDEDLRRLALELSNASPIFDEPPWPDGRRGHIRVTPNDPHSVMAGIYMVRNNLFHGAKEFEPERDHGLVQIATQLLEKVFVKSGLYDMARQPGRALDEPIA